MIRLLFLLAALVSGPAAAATVTAEFVCAVRAEIRETPWSPALCALVAAVTNRTEDPRTTFAIEILESGLVEKAVSPPTRIRNGKYRGKKAQDVGLMGVRCVLGRGGRCLNWPVVGMTPAELTDPENNITVGVKILTEKKRVCGARWAACYNGDPDGSNRYGAKVLAMTAAMGGVEPTKGVGRRVRSLAKKVLVAVFRIRRS